jgi:hypothetical protein
MFEKQKNRKREKLILRDFFQHRMKKKNLMERGTCCVCSGPASASEGTAAVPCCGESAASLFRLVRRTSRSL